MLKLQKVVYTKTRFVAYNTALLSATTLVSQSDVANIAEYKVVNKT